MVTIGIMRHLGTVIALLAVLAIATPVWADEVPLAPSDFRAFDSPSDHGGGIDLKWQRSPDDGAGRNIVTAYEISRSATPEGEFSQVAWPLKGVTAYSDNGLTDGA